MTRIEAEEEAILALGRRALAPSAVDRARVRGSLSSALAATLAEPKSVPESAAGSASGLPTSAASAKLAVTKVAAMRFLAAALTGVVGTGVGYWWGYGAGLEARSAQILLSPPPPSVLSAAPPASEASSAEPEPEPEPEPVSGDGPSRPVAPTRAGRAAQRPQAPAQQRPMPQVPPDEELRVLRRAERALRQGNPRLALVLLEDLSRSTSGGRLLEERAAEMVVARCALEPSEGARLRLEFERAHSDSVYLDRVNQSCVAGRE